MNKSKSAPFILGIVAVALSLSVVFAQYSTKKEEFPSYPNLQTPNTDSKTSANVENTKSTTTSTSPKPTTTGTKSSEYTLAQVASHNKSSDCWTAINGEVYNVTSWIKDHPGGGGAIISLCGIDGSSAFNDQHGGERRPANELASFKIGTLK
jgi:cytochrome b involved in lipid metabolism